MRELTEELARYGQAVEQAVPPAERPATEPTQLPPRRSRRKPALAAAAIVLLLVPAATALWLTKRGGEGSADKTLATTADRVTPGQGWQRLPKGPTEADGASALIATDDEVLFWPDEGAGDENIGAAYDISTQQWRTIAPVPLEPGRAAAVWTGDEVLVWTDPNTVTPDEPWSGAAWDPTTDRWRRLPPGPVPAALDVTRDIVWTGGVAFVAGLDATYDPTTDRWREVAPPPDSGVAIAAARMGHDVITLRWIEGTGADSIASSIGQPSAASYDPEQDEWSELGPPPIIPIGATLARAGDRLLAIDYEMQAATLAPGETEWDQADPLPLRFYEGIPLVAGGKKRAVVVRSTGTGMFDPALGWSLLSPPPNPVHRIAVADGLVLGGTTESAASLARPDSDDAVPFGTFPVGTVQLDLPPGAALTGTGLREWGVITELSFEIALRDSAPCTVTSSYRNGLSDLYVRGEADRWNGDLGRFALEDLPPDAGRDALSAEFAPGTRSERAHLLIVETTSDVLDIACDDLAAARDLASGIGRPDPTD